MASDQKPNSFFNSVVRLFLTGLLLSGCSRHNNPLLSTPGGSVNSELLSIPQIDTHAEPFNKVFLRALDNGITSNQNFQIGNFSLLENGRPNVPVEEGPVTDPLYIALVIDRSGSMASSTTLTTTRNDAATAGALSLVSAMGALDQMCYIEFDTEVNIRQSFTSDKSALNAAISAGTPGTNTALFDGISTGVDQLQGVSGRKLLIVMGDGDDNSSVNSLQGAIRDVKSGGISANMIILGNGVSDTSAFSGLAGATGGEFQTSLDGTSLSGIFVAILNKMQNLVYVKYRKRASSGTLTVFLNYGAITASATREF